MESTHVDRSTGGYDPGEREARRVRSARAKYERPRPRLGNDAPAWEHLAGADRWARITAEMRTDQPRYLLALKVRGCAAAAGDDAGFVRRMRSVGVLVRARYADGRTDVITGDSVAERPAAGERPIW